MKATIEARDLARALRRTMKAKDLRFSAGDDRVRIITMDDYEACLTVEIAAQVEEPGAISGVGLGMFRALVPRSGAMILTAGDESLSFGGIQLWGAESSEAKAAVPTGPAAPFDADALAWVLRAAASDEARPILTGVLFADGRLVAADNYRIHEASGGPSGFSALVRRPHAELAAKLGLTAVAPTKRGVVFTGPDCTLDARCIDGTYPPTRQVTAVPRGATRLVCDGRELAEVAQRIVKARLPITHLRSFAGGLQVYSEIDTLVSVNVLIKARGSLGPIALNPRYLAEAIGDGPLTIRSAGDLKPLHIEQGARHAHVMPIRTHEVVMMPAVAA